MFYCLDPPGLYSRPGFYSGFTVILSFNEIANIRANNYKLHNHFFSSYYDLFFSARIVNIWNSLSNKVVDACTVNAFKEWLDKFWQHQAVKFDFTADLTGTGNLSEEVIV